MSEEKTQAFKLGLAFYRGLSFKRTHVLAEDRDKWITVKGTHIPLDEQGNLKGKLGEKADKTSTQRKKNLDVKSFNRDLDLGKSPRSVLREAAKEMKGSYEVILPDVGKSEVVLGSSFVSESAKYLYSGQGASNPSKRKEIAKRQLFAMSKLEAILSDGIKTKWTNNPLHHPDYDFLTVYKKLNYQGKDILFSVDINRRGKKQEKKIYNTSNSKNSGFTKKLKNSVIPIQKANDSDMKVICEIACIRC